jgi:A/G-specific adenine glycosylase
MGADAGLTRSRLLRWYTGHARDLPWRRTRDPYRIWVSEIMLQQTRAQAVIPYYERFLERFPTVAALAAASESAVLACWSGLGYYSRARHMREAARQIVDAGGFPEDYESLRALPGVGDYTAAAIASIAFGLPRAVLDGNVLRVISRLRNDPSDIGSPQTKSRFREYAQELLDAKDPGRFNQALMELGATVCLPKSPQCPHCPLATRCRARLEGNPAALPVRPRRTEPVRVNAALALVERRGRVLLWQRPSSGRMAGFWELPSLGQLPNLKPGRTLGSFRHSITHHRYLFHVLCGSIARVPAGFRWFSVKECHTIPLSTTARKALLLARDLI